MSQTIKLSKNDRVKVKVLDKRQFTNKAIYEVEYMGRKVHVPMFEFQKSLPLPEEMECVVQMYDGVNLYLSQNISSLLREHYNVGETYEFVIADDYTRASSPHYKLTDGSGFFFKLKPPRGVKLLKNHKIRCRLLRFHGIDADLEYLGPVYEVISGFDIKTLVDRLGIDAVRLINRYRRAEGISEVTDRYESGSPEWIPAAIEFALDHLERADINTLSQADLDNAAALARIIVWLLEDSDYFDNFHEADRTMRHERFRHDLRRATALSQAMEMILSGKQSDYINRMLAKLNASGYLIDAELKLRVMRNVFAIDNALLTRRIDSLIAVALKRRDNCMSEVTFRRAFVELLQIYVDSNCRQLDTMDEAETQAAREQLNVMIRVIALQLLMADDSDNDFDYRLNRSRLYRYLTLQNNSGDEQLFDKALNALLSCEPWRNEHNWRDLEQFLSLTSCLRQENSTATLPAIFDTAQAVIKVSDSEISVESTAGANVECEGLQKLNLWKGLNVKLDNVLPAEVKMPRTIPQYKRMWNAIERRLTMAEESTEKETVPSRRQALPSVGDDVNIEITGAHPTIPGRFFCRVVEAGLRGEGWIDKTDISANERDLPYDIFLDDNRKPFIFLANVKNIADDDSIHFSMIEIINDWLNDSIHYDNVEECVILKKRVDEATCLSRRGFVLNVKLDQPLYDLEKGDVITVSQITVSPNGNWREGHFVSVVGGRIDYIDVMRNLMAEYAFKEDELGEEITEEDEIDVSEDVGMQDASRLDATQVSEIARLIEHVGASTRENRLAYNYFAFARLLSVLISDNQLVEYYTKRCDLLEELDIFFTNGRVDLTRLENLTPDLMKDNSSLSNDVAKLRILAVLDHSDNNHRLWEIFSTDANESLQELARLVLAYNMLDGFKMRDERLAIRKKLYSRLKVDIDMPPAVVADGMEDLHTEFKTSTVYPANSMRIDVAAQTLVILKVICAFMNTEGGTLYIGVSDEGYIRGLESDLSYFGERRDRFDRNIHDNMRTHMGFIPNLQLYFSTEWMERDGKEIYCVKVKPLYEPVAVDGVYYYREGSSCVMVRQDDEAQFLQSRRDLGVSRGIGTDSTSFHASDNAASSAATAVVHQPKPYEIATPKKCSIPTSVKRNNVLHDGYEGYLPVVSYLYIYDDLSFEITDDDRWMEESTALTLGLHASECDDTLLVISDDGYATRIPMASLRDSSAHFSPKINPAYIAPVTDEDSIILIYRDSSGSMFKRVFDVSDIKLVKPEERGEMLSRDIAMVLFCETLVGDDERQLFKPLVRKVRIGKDDEALNREKEIILSRIPQKM